MGMRISLGLVVACVGGALLASACGSVGDPAGEQVAQVREKSVFQAPQAHDTLAVYAARCDAATGIHVPPFSCNQGVSSPAGNHFAWIDQKTSIDNVTNDGALAPVGSSTGGRTPPDVAVTAKRMTASTGTNISGLLDNFQFAYVPAGNVLHETGGTGAGQAEVKIANYESFSSSTNAMAGVMVRTVDAADLGTQHVLDQDSPHAMLGISPSGNVHFRYRTAKGANTVAFPVVSGQGFPLWLRLSWQQGVGMKGEYSHDHAAGSWQTVGVAPVMPNPLQLYAGVAVAAATVNYDRLFTTQHCDRPSALGGSCDLKSSFQVLARTADAIAVGNCRNQGPIGDNLYNDIAVIQYNRKNGALCFYQSPPESLNGSWVTAPSDPAGTFPWVSPEATHGGGCTGCHDTGGLNRSPYLKQTGLLPGWGEGYNNDGGNPLTYVGHDYQNDRSYWVAANKAETDTGGNCTSCHGMAVNNVKSDGGTTRRFARQATAPNQNVETDGFFVSHKNPASATSPLWMRPDTVGPGAVYPDQYYEPAAITAGNYRDCGSLLESNDWETDTTTWGAPPDPTLNCSYGEHGVPYNSPIQILEDIQWGNGGSSSGTLDNVTINSGDHTDIFGNSDTGVLAHTLIAPTDGSAMVKITSLKNSNAYAKAGVMFRAGSAANAANVMVALTAQHGATFQYRPTAGAATPTPAYLGSMTFPVWLRLDRSGETFVGFVSTDNRATWQQVGQAVTLPGFAGSHLGLVNTAHSQSTQTGQAAFEAFDFTPAFGWAGDTDPHILVDAKVGSGTGSRTEWITREYIKAGGGDIQGNSDNFWYSFKTFDGNGELFTTVESLSSTAQWGKAGLMLRDSASNTAKNVFVAKTPSGVTFQYRDATGGGTTANNVSTPNQPTQLRLVRSGLTFTGYYRAQGSSTWISLGSHAFSSFNAKALTGLAASSQTAGAETNAVFYSGKKVEPPAFLWPIANPDPGPGPGPGMTPCAGLCDGATSFTFGNNYQSGQLGTGAVCLETTHAVLGGNCSNVFSGRQFLLNDVTEVCNGQNWSSVPPPRNGGYCVELTPGQRQDAAFTVF